MRVCLLLGTAAVVVGQTLKLEWMTDSPCPQGKQLFCGPRGPDGPWQGLKIGAAGFPGEAFLPGGHWGTQMLTTATGANYDPTKSKTANLTANLDTIVFEDPWASTFNGDGGFGRQYYEFLVVGDVHFKAKTTIVATQQWLIDQNGFNYTSQFGTLGLAPHMSDGDDRPSNVPPSILEQCKEEGLVTSNSYGLHIGSVALSQPGSLVLGGYEQNRAIGDVAVFDLQEDRGEPKAFLLDMTLGVEKGDSPFNNTKLGSVWQGIGNNGKAAEDTKKAGGVRGSVLCTFNPVKPYLYLPPGNCAAVAERLPVTWREELSLYTWDTEDPQFERIVNSPAYIGFVFADRTAKNITIKIPFKLLNLTLEEPIVDKPIPYFPCKPTYGETLGYEFGRTFLQGAFLGLNYEKNLMYLAQAPGPDMEQSVIKVHGKDDTSIATRPADAFEKSWRSTWTVINEEGGEKDTGNKNGSSNSTGPSEDGSGSGPDASSSSPASGLSTGAIAGIAVGIVAVIAAAAVLTFFLWRRRRVEKPVVIVGDKEEYLVMPEAPGGELAHELFAPKKWHEAPGIELYHELDSRPLSREPGSHGIR